ncbi:arginyl-tRNA--protein transferase 1 isoform X4 [Procambarus clarkii]|uniref:arginyl-tRNA--protein transferase 1 isoform X4 n=1 Tax=Procambarus clarkii TaxID=6728 RepID=UPI001E676E45|nr:arginyl-tRNA--protein transferase 1-like isoform X4 [Procambarus clarkii]
MAEGDQDPSCSIVEYMRDHSGYKCGYCKSENTNFSHGMWAHRLAVNHYQDLIDRGWRRSGKYCYKPIMDKTCCPMYTIKCDILEFKLSKSQKKILKRIHRYLSHGDVKEERSLGNDNSGNIQGNPEYVKPRLESTQDLSSVSLSANATNTRKNSEPYTLETNDGSLNSKKACVNPKMEKNVSCHKTNLESSSQHSFQAKKVTSTGPDPNRPPCRKAKEVRRERKEAKLAKIAQEAVTRGESPMDTKKFKPSNTQKTLEDYINEPLPENPAHNLEGWHPHTGPQQGYGSFHHQYWLDGRLIAVGVLDILPHCVSSVYLYYDPEFSFLSLGTYASLREIALTRELQRRVLSLKSYYMGFYIHSCPKMRYKGRYNPSFLLCPETYDWIPIESAVSKLDVAKYSRLNDDTSAIDENGQLDINEIQVLYEQEPMRYGRYRILNADGADDDEVREYGTLVGAKCANSIYLYRS